jgi:hypothetical protein
VDIYTDSADGLHYSLMIGTESAGSFQFFEDKHDWTYVGELIRNEQVQIAGFIKNYTDDNWEN